MVAVEIAHAVVANAILAIADLDGDLHTVVAVKLVQLICIADQESDRASFRLWRSLPQEQLYFAEVHAREGRRLAPGERLGESEAPRVEVQSRGKIIGDEDRLHLFTFDEGSRIVHEALTVGVSTTAGNRFSQKTMRSGVLLFETDLLGFCSPVRGGCGTS